MHFFVLLMGTSLESVGSSWLAIPRHYCPTLPKPLPSGPPASQHTNMSLVSHMTSVTRRCDGMLLACYASAGAPCWAPSILKPIWCCGWLVCDRLRKKVKRSQGSTENLERTSAAAIHHRLFSTFQAGWILQSIGGSYKRCLHLLILLIMLNHLFLLHSWHDTRCWPQVGYDCIQHEQ